MSKKEILEIGEFKKVVKKIPEGVVHPEMGIRKNFVMSAVEEVKNADNDERVLRFVISSDSVDRDDDTLAVDGWDVSNYLKNPVVLFGHDGRSPPVAKANNVFFENGLFKSDAQFMPKDMYEFSDMLYKMYLGGFMRATSVGFNPTEWTWSDARDYGIDFKKQELLEYSLVPVPANPDAIMEARKSGIETTPLVAWAEEVLDTKKYKGLYVPKSIIEGMHKDADGKSKVTIWMNNDEVVEVEMGKEETTSDIKETKDEPVSTKAGDDEISDTDTGKDGSTETAKDESNAESETEDTKELTLADFELDKDTGFLKLKGSPDKDTNLSDESKDTDSELINKDEGDSDGEKDFIEEMISALGTDNSEGKSKDTEDNVFTDLSANDLAEAISSAVKSEVATLTGKLD